MQWQVLNIKGEAQKTVELSDAIFASELNEHVLHSVVKGYRANRRQGTHATKTRSLVSGGGKKPFRQKGTGNARQGSSRSPLMPGGGTSHGPQPRNYRERTNSKTRRLALKVALADKVRHKRLVLVDDFASTSYSTKHVGGVLKALTDNGRALLADVANDFLYRSARNIHGASAKTATSFNAEDVLRHEYLILSEAGLAELERRLSGVAVSEKGA